MDINKYYLNLITQTPINYNGLIFYQPSLEEILEYDMDLYNQAMMVFTITPDCLNNIPQTDNFNMFEDAILNNDYLIRCLCESLYILTKADEIALYKNSKYIQLIFSSNTNDQISQTTFDINASNFDDISEIILKINANKKIEIEKPPANMSPKQRDIWEKLQEGRSRDAKKNEIHIYDILNVCEYCVNYISIDEIKKWSMWRIMNCYKAKMCIKSYDDNLKIALVSGNGESISGDNHWHYQLMIRD